MKCIYSQEDIEKFIEGILSIQEADKMEKHINLYKKCSSFYEALQLFSKFTSNNNTTKCNINEKILCGIDKDRYLNNKYSISHIIYKISPVLKPISAVAVAIIFVICVIFNAQNMNNSPNSPIDNPISLQSPLQSPDVTNTYTPDSTHMNISEDTPAQKVIPLAFENLDFEQEMQTLNENSIKEVIKEYHAEGVSLFTFRKKDDDFIIYLGIKADKLYEVDEVGYGNFEVQIKSTFLFGKSLIRVEGIVGSTAPVTYYIYIENSVPRIFLFLSRAVSEIDVDSDGNKDIISSVLGSTEIYKIKNDQLMYSSLNEILNADNVFFLSEEKDLIFVAYPEPSEQIKYKLTKEGLLPLD